ncbi:TlpA family protein disulfide reductase, partial [bacterium]
MIKKVFIFFFLLYSHHAVFAQKHFQVTVNLDSSIVPEKVSYQYNDGKIVKFFDGSSKRQLVLKGTYFSAYASFNISYITKDNVYYLTDFFVDDKNASIDFYYKPNIDQILLYKNVKNARPIYDTVTNKTYRELTHFNRAENLAIYNFIQKNQLDGNDSLRNRYLQMIKSVDKRSMQFLKRYPNDYFSFWYFKNNIVKEQFKNDTAYLKEQITYFKQAFPKKFTESIEGREFIKTNERILHPLKADKAAPAFSIKTIDGKNISLASLKGRYVLLDFWATWCAPCMRDVPFIKTVRKRYAPDKLIIIGISQDRNLAKLKQVIKQQGMNWVHYYDGETEISKLYGINEFPTLILLDDKGKIIYKSGHIK